MEETNYFSTLNGNRFYPLEGRVNKVDLEDIAHGLAYQCRFNGQTREFYSVAEHSLRVAEIVPAEYRLEALMHDAAEYTLGDMVTPMKKLFPFFKEMEDKFTDQLAEHFGLDFSNYAVIKKADLVLLATEKRDLMPRSTEPWGLLEGIEPLAATIHPTMEPEVVKRAFLERFAQYVEERQERGASDIATWVEANDGKPIESVEDGKRYQGTIIHENEHCVAQNLGRSVAIHRKADLDRVPAVGDLASVRRQDGGGVVTVVQQGLGRGVGVGGRG